MNQCPPNETTCPRCVQQEITCYTVIRDLIERIGRLESLLGNITQKPKCLYCFDTKKIRIKLAFNPPEFGMMDCFHCKEGKSNAI